jgi:DUF2946 family protein
MRRKLQFYLPVFLMALMVQILAPIGASWTVAATLSDPFAAFGGAVICHSDGSQSDTADQPGQTGHHVHEGCALCCLAHAGGSMDTPSTAAFAEPYRPSLRMVWHDAEARLRDTRGSGHAQARAPPSIS